VHSEDDLLPISALQHLLFCERQTALVHIERQWEDNRFTAEGNVLHKKADAAKSETRDGVRITRGLQVHSLDLGLYGICDVVQFKPPVDTGSRQSLPKRINAELSKAASLDPLSHSTPTAFSDSQPVPHPRSLPPQSTAFAHWAITPVEYKRGKPKANDCDRVQLCAQAMCLEEMLHIAISAGDLFYGKQQRRTEVPFDDKLRATTRQTALRLQALIQSEHTPAATKEKKCDTCSLLAICMPSSKKQKSASGYLNSMINE